MDALLLCRVDCGQIDADHRGQGGRHRTLALVALGMRAIDSASGGAARVSARETGERIKEPGAEVIADTPDEFAATNQADLQKFAKLVKAAGIQAD